MKTTILVNDLKELKIVASFYGIEVKSSEIVVSFPYRLEYEDDTVLSVFKDEEMTFEEFRRRYLKNN